MFNFSFCSYWVLKSNIIIICYFYLVDEGNEELFAMVNERWSATHVPVLVLSCVHDASQSRIPCITIVEKLEMAKLNRPWQVM